MNRYLAQSVAFHFTLFAFFLAFSFFSPRQKIIWLDGAGFDFKSGGGSGKGKSLKGGLKASKRGQPVPKPVKVKVPEKPAPAQRATTAEEAWKVNDKKKKKPIPVKAQKTEHTSLPIGEKKQKAQSNIIRRGIKKGEGREEGGFSFEEGKGVGIGVGPGTGGGFGFGGYLKILRARIWAEWTQYTTIGTDKSCVVGLTVARSGQVSNIRLETSSGDAIFDDVARRSVRNASPLSPLPPNFPNSTQRFRIKFQLID